jgi:hypothetical protein
VCERERVMEGARVGEYPIKCVEKKPEEKKAE